MVRVVESAGKENGIDKSLWMTLGISDGTNLWGFRYGSDGKGPTLYVSPDISELARMNPLIKEKLGDFAACIVSEPIGDYQDLWHPIPDNSRITIADKKIEVKDFNPYGVLA
jgi:hypothetical protein